MFGEFGLKGLASIYIAGLFYLTPSLIAWYRAHHNRAAIIALNLLLGWTVLGWIGALIWALTRPPTTTHGGTI